MSPVDEAVRPGDHSDPEGDEAQHRPEPNGAAFSGFVCGLLGMIFSSLWVTVVPLGLGLDLAAIGLSMTGRRYAGRDFRQVSASSLSLAGLVLGTIGLAIGITSLAIFM